jgi:hypothetical protein
VATFDVFRVIRVAWSVLTAGAEVPTASRSLARALPYGVLARGLCRVSQRRSLLDAVSGTCDSYATAYRDLIPRWTYSARSALVFARAVRFVKGELGHVVICTVLSGSSYRLRSTSRIGVFTRDSSLLPKFRIALAEACTAGTRDGWRTGSREQSNRSIASAARQARGVPNGVCKTSRGIDRRERPIVAPVRQMNSRGQEGSP